MARRTNVIPYSRSYRRPPRWGMGLPPRKPVGRFSQMLRRLARRPLGLLKLTMLLAGLGFIVLPHGFDLANAALRPVASSEGDCRVLVVVDGDTVKLVCPTTGLVTARLLGFDSPEKFSPGCARELVAAERATWALRLMIFGAKRLELTPDGTDRYGRMLARLTLDGVDVSRLMIRAGHARAYGGGLRGGWC
jgi:micrococcal nuclease